MVINDRKLRVRCVAGIQWSLYQKFTTDFAGERIFLDP